jgi:hypothetical protein
MKYTTKHYFFDTGTNGIKAHKVFIKYINENGFKIVNAWVDYHDYGNSHIPRQLNYVIQFEKDKL